MLGRTGRNIREAPGRLKLELGDLVRQQIYEHLDQVGFDNLLDRWRVLNGKQFPDADACEQLGQSVGAVDHANESRHLVDL